MSYRADLSNPFEVNEFIKVSGSAVATRFPNAEAQMARIVAYSGNNASFLIGGQTTCFFEMAAGTDTGWFGIDNLSELYFSNPSGTTNYLSVWIQR